MKKEKTKAIKIWGIGENDNEADILRYVASQVEEGYTNGLVGATTIEWSMEEK